LLSHHAHKDQILRTLKLRIPVPLSSLLYKYFNNDSKKNPASPLFRRHNTPDVACCVQDHSQPLHPCQKYNSNFVLIWLIGTHSIDWQCNSTNRQEILATRPRDLGAYLAHTWAEGRTIMNLSENIGSHVFQRIPIISSRW